MVNYALINKEVIPYVCTRKRITMNYLYTSTKLKKESIDKWYDASNPALPTIRQAKKLADCLDIPFASLYMNTSDIPVKSLPSIKNFRTMNGSLAVDDSSINIAIYDILQKRDFLIEESNELDIPIPKFSIAPFSSSNPNVWANEIRKRFSITTKDQFSCASNREFYLYLRDRLESKGIFVQCFSNIPVEVIRGFAIYKQALPIIGINNDDRSPAKSFTLIHELVHLLKRESSMCNNMNNTTSSYEEEVFCNAVAGDLLVPKEELFNVLHNVESLDANTIQKIARKFSISREVIIRRLLDCGVINKTEYTKYAKEFKEEINRKKEEQKLLRQNGLTSSTFSRDISRETIDKTSSAVCKMLYYGYFEEQFSKRDIALHLGIKYQHVDKFLKKVASRWNS